MPRKRDVLMEARGRWPGVLAAIGVDEKHLSGKHGSCPIPGCGGKDRFRFDDKEGRGTYFCAQCGAGDGIKLVMLLKGLDFKEALKLVESMLPLAQHVKVAKERSDRSKAAALERRWEQAQVPAADGPVSLYLRNRGITIVSPMVREIPRLAYYDEDMKIAGEYPAMVARIADPRGAGVSLHITYLSSDGQKAPVPAVKKVMSPVGQLMGAAVQLFPPTDSLGVTEGIECALSIHQMIVSSAQFGRR